MLSRARNRQPPVALKALAKLDLIGRRALEQRKDAVKARTATERALIGALRHIEGVAQVVERNVADLNIGNIE